MNILSFCEAERNNLWKAISRKIVYILFSTTQNYIEFFFPHDSLGFRSLNFTQVSEF